MAGGKVEQRGAVLGLVRLGVDASTVTVQKTLLLQAVAGELVVGVGQRQTQVTRVISPAELAEKLAYV